MRKTSFFCVKALQFDTILSVPLFGMLTLTICIAPNLAVAQPNKDCRATPPFMNTKGFDMSKMAFSTSDRRNMGLVATEVNLPVGKTPKIYRHPSWKNAGWLGPMIITEEGAIWVAPVPVINTLHNKPEDQNTLWKVDPNTAEMAAVLKLPIPKSDLNNQNPYGLMALGYDCETKHIYASSVAGTTLDSVRGVLYSIHSGTLKIVDTIANIDAFGLGVGAVNGEKRLYFGLARSGEIRSVGLKTDGSFDHKFRTELSLEDLGPRGDDRARKIRFSPDGTLTITGIEFYFNLTAPTEKQETVYQFKYNAGQSKWQLSGIQ